MLKNIKIPCHTSHIEHDNNNMTRHDMTQNRQHDFCFPEFICRENCHCNNNTICRNSSCFDREFSAQTAKYSYSYSATPRRRRRLFAAQRADAPSDRGKLAEPMCTHKTCCVALPCRPDPARKSYPLTIFFLHIFALFCFSFLWKKNAPRTRTTSFLRPKAVFVLCRRC